MHVVGAMRKNVLRQAKAEAAAALAAGQPLRFYRRRPDATTAG